MSERILIVDDDASRMKSLESALHGVGYPDVRTEQLEQAEVEVAKRLAFAAEVRDYPDGSHRRG